MSNHESPYLKEKNLKFTNADDAAHVQSHHNHHQRMHTNPQMLHRAHTHQDGHIPQKKSAFWNASLEELPEVAIGGLSPPNFRARIIKNTEVTFNFTCADTVPGDQVAMVGNMPLLGHWDPMKAVPLTTNPQNYPIWSIKIDLPRDKIIEYKYLVIKSSNAKKQGGSQIGLPGRGFIEWESLPQGINRLVSTQGKKEITIYEALGSQEIVEEYVEAAAGGERKLFMSSNDLFEKAARQGAGLVEDEGDMNDRRESPRRKNHHHKEQAEKKEEVL